MAAPMPQDFAAVIEARHSLRTMRPAPLREVVNAIGFATRPRFVREGDARARSRRPSPSAGALHPIDTLIVDRRGSARVMRYDAAEHRLELMSVDDPIALTHFAQSCAEILPDAPATALVLIGRLSRVAAVYENPASLLWRDAGALLQTLALAATAYRLAFCPLGILGDDVVRATGLRGEAQAVGCAVVGRPLDPM